MWTIFKVLIVICYNLASVLLFFFWFFGHKGSGILAPHGGMEPAPCVLKGKVVTTGPPGKSLSGNSILILIFFQPFKYVKPMLSPATVQKQAMGQIYPVH